MLFFIFHTISITTLVSSSLASSWPGLMPDMDIDSNSFAKSKCVEYIITSNIVVEDLVVIWRRPKSKVIGHSLIQRIMSVANVQIASEFKTVHIWNKYSRIDVMLPSTRSQRQMAHDDDDDESFRHKLNKGNVFIIETSVSACDRTIASISKSIVYDSRANFILLVSVERNDTMVDDDRTTHSCENKIKRKNHLHNDEQCDTIHINTFNNVTNTAGIDRKTNDEKMIHGTLKHVFGLLWTRHIFNAIIMLCETIDTISPTTTTSKMSTDAALDVCAIYTWFPYDESSKCGQRIEDFVKIDECVYDKNRKHLQFHYSEENKWYFGVSDGDEQGQINNRRVNESASDSTGDIRRNGNHVRNENKIVVGNVPHTFAYTFQMDKNFNNNTSLFNMSLSTANGECEMKIASSSSNINASDVDGIERFNLCALNALNPSVRLFVINETQTNRERVRNQEMAQNYFKYVVREFGTIEFRKNPNVEHLTMRRTEMPSNINAINAKITRSPSILMERIISNRYRPHFYEKIPSDLHGCVYDTHVIVWPPFVTPVTAAFYGLEHKLLLDVARHMNYQMNETHKRFNISIEDGGKNAYSYGALVNSSASLAFGNIYPVANMHNKYDASIGYLYDHVNWAVPLATTAPAWLNLFNCFRSCVFTKNFKILVNDVAINIREQASLKIWILIGIVLIVFTFFYSTLGKWAEHFHDKIKSKQRKNNGRKCRSRHSYGKDDNPNGFSRRNNGPRHEIPVSRFFIQCYQLSLGFAVTKLPRSTSTRVLLVAWSFYCFNIILFYQSQLIITLSSPATEKQITKPEEIIAKNIPFGFPKSFEVHLERMNTTTGRYFIENNRECTFRTCLKEMDRAPFATMGNRMYLQYSIAFENKQVKFYTITKPVAKSFVQMIMRKGFPLRDKINFKIRRMIEIGYLAACQTFYQKIVANVSIYNPKRRTKEYLEMEHFIGAYFLLAAGFLLALVTFIAEIALNAWVESKQKSTRAYRPKRANTTERKKKVIISQE